jgi:hypothetical protein
MSEYESARDKALKAITVPKDDEFSQDYVEGPAPQILADVLIEHCDEVEAAGEFKIKFAWKRTGGKSTGMATLGKCVKLSGLTLYFGKVDFVVWLAADHCRDRAGINLAALMFHELLHIDQDENGLPTSRGHEFEGFSAEIERFGIWRESIRPIATAFKESPFPEEQANEGSDRRPARGARVRKPGDRASSAAPAS